MRVAEAHRQVEPLFEVTDIKNANSLIRKLIEGRGSVSVYLRGRLSQDLQQQLNAYFESDSEAQLALQQALVNELNTILEGDSIYLPFRFPPLTAKTLESAKPSDQVKREKLTRANRALLEEAYPNEIMPSLTAEPSDGWWDASFGRRPVSMTSALSALFMWVLQAVFA